MEVLNMPLGSFLFFYVGFAVEVILVVFFGLYWYFKDSKTPVTSESPKDISG